MSEPHDRDYLEHILHAAEAIGRSSAGGRERFLTDEDAFDAGLRRLHTIAESTQRLSNELKDRHPEIPWARIASVVQNELPALVRLAGSELGRP